MLCFIFIGCRNSERLGGYILRGKDIIRTWQAPQIMLIFCNLSKIITFLIMSGYQEEIQQMPTIFDTQEF